MLQFLKYRTPQKFFNEFDEHIIGSNLRSVRIMSALLLFVAGSARIAALIFHEDVLKISGYHRLSISNWVQITMSTSFFLMSTYALKKDMAPKLKKALTILFVLFFLTAAFNLSYIISLNNTKNTLLVFLVAIVATSLFFSFEYHIIKYIVIYIGSVYFIVSCLSSVPIEQKIINFIADIILSIALLSFSRYAYYFKSSHFVQIKQLEEKNKEILLLNNQKTEILSFVAHDLRAPLNNIDALSQLLTLNNGDNNEIKMISNAALQAKNIINDLIEAVKTEQTDIVKERIHLNAYLERIIAKWETNTTRKIEFNHPQESLSLQANASKLERVIDNLISNAFKFSSAEKPIKIGISKLKNNVLIKVKDFGIGIPKEMQAHVFEQFSKASRKGLMGEKSIGLGLHISHKIIKQHHGELLVTSAENQGTTFTIQLPLRTV